MPQVLHSMCQHIAPHMLHTLQDGGVRPPVSFEDLDHFFTPGSYNADDPRRCNKQMQHVNVIYPRRDVCAVIAACFPVINGKVVMRYKPVFTTAATQPYGGTFSLRPEVIACLVVYMAAYARCGSCF